MRTLLGLGLLLVSWSTPAAAQDFRVYTVVRDVASPGGPTAKAENEGPVVGRSLTLFRARKCYDWLEDLGEVVVTDRTHNRVCVIDGDLRGVRLLDEERRHFLKLGRREAERYIDELPDRLTRTALAATLDPQLEVDWNEEVERLTLSGGGWQYDVTTAVPPDPAYVDAYLDYADAAAEVNFLLHPQSLYPSLRQTLNAELRRLGRLPIEVTLRGQPGQPIALRAEHKYEWTLQSFDRSQIRRWDQLATDRSESAEGGVRWLSIQDFQQASVPSR